MIKRIRKLSLPKKWINKSLILTLKLSFVLMFVLSSILYFINYAIKKNIVEETHLEQLNELDTFYLDLRYRISRIESYIYNLSNDRHLALLLNEDDEDVRNYLEQRFSQIIEYNKNDLIPTFDQMRILNISGIEILRVDLNENSPEVITKMQDKSKRYYFKAMEKLEDNDLYLSPIDLNVENGKIEEPWNPVFRVGTPIIDSDKKRVGYLIINVKFDEIISAINNFNTHEDDQWYMLNENGYYIYHHKKDKTFTFMFDDKKDKGFFDDYKTIWNDYTQKNKIIHKSHDGYIYIRSFNFNDETKFNCPKSLELYLIMHMTNKSLETRVLLLRRGLLTGFLLMGPILFIISILLGSSITKNNYYISLLEKRSSHDSLTSLLNKRGITEQLKSHIKLSKRLNNNLSLIFIDLNDLKKVNDTLGHAHGDILIRSMADSIKLTIRESDYAARIGGDEFLILLLNSEQSDMKFIVDRINDNYIQLSTENFNFIPRFSYGFSYWNNDIDNIDDFINRADYEMYKMKKNK